MTIVALIPARAGSKRVPGKNTKLLGGKPLIQWTLDAAHESGVFGESIYKCTDDIKVWAKTPNGRTIQRLSSDDTEPDIAWVRYCLPQIERWEGRKVDAFAILRPTSPFRTADTIRRAVKQFIGCGCSSLRAVSPVTEHPAKMWTLGPGDSMTPLVGAAWHHVYGAIEHCGDIPFHSRPSQTLPQVYVQNASLEIAFTWCVTTCGTISGPHVAPFFTEGWEGFDINTPDDWARAEAHVAEIARVAGVSPAAATE